MGKRLLLSSLGQPQCARMTQVLYQPQPQTQGQLCGMSFNSAVPFASGDINRMHHHAMATGILNKLGGRIKSHRLAV